MKGLPLGASSWPELGRRRPENPLIRPASLAPSVPGLEVKTVCNAAAGRLSDGVGLLLRVGESLAPSDSLAQFMQQKSHLRLATSPDGLGFEVAATPTVYPSRALDEWGCEDPRATLIEGVWYITYVGVSRLGICTSLLGSENFREFEHLGVLFQPDMKNVALFPERHLGQYVALTRPMTGFFNKILGIWIARSPDLLHWGNHLPLVLPRPGQWDSARVGAGAVPLRIEAGWLLIYHGADDHNRYGLGALLLAGDNPNRVLARSPAPILWAKADYERQGFVNEVVFTCGLIDLEGDRKQIRVYYGAGDQFMAAADFEVEEILAHLVPV